MLKSRLDEIKTLITNDDFLSNKGLSNEVGIHTFCYNAKDEMIVRNYIEKLEIETDEKYNIIVYDLYEFFLSFLADKGILSKIESQETKAGKDKLLTKLQNLASADKLVDKMVYSPHNFGDVIFLTGIEKVFPFMRTHKILDCMQPSFGDVPIIVLYPGDFDGQGLSLFGKLDDGNYYRAFNIIKEQTK